EARDLFPNRISSGRRLDLNAQWEEANRPDLGDQAGIEGKLVKPGQSFDMPGTEVIIDVETKVILKEGFGQVQICRINAGNLFACLQPPPFGLQKSLHEFCRLWNTGAARPKCEYKRSSLPGNPLLSQIDDLII